MRMSTVKELSSKWIMSAYDYMNSSPQIVCNGFRRAGISSAVERVDAVEDTVSPQDSLMTPLTLTNTFGF